MTNVHLPAVILGKSECARDIFRALSQQPSQNRKGKRDLRIVAIFSDLCEKWPEAEQLGVFVSETRWAREFVQYCRIRHAIVAVPEKCDSETEKLVGQSVRLFKQLFIAPKFVSQEFIRTSETRGGKPLALAPADAIAGRKRQALKRLVDVVGAVLFGLILLPVFLVAAVTLRFSSKGPILYKQARIGRGNRAFTALKFRTMWTNAEERLDDYLAKDPALREQWHSVKKLKSDPRITPAGRFLRRFSLDELPQLWNVLIGDMSLIGPRPIVVAEIEKYGPDYAAYERVRPGLTGLWQVSGRNNTTYQQRVDYDSYYVRNWSLWLDVKILARTFGAVISGAGAY